VVERFFCHFVAHKSQTKFVLIGLIPSRACTGLTCKGTASRKAVASQATDAMRPKKVRFFASWIHYTALSKGIVVDKHLLAKTPWFLQKAQALAFALAFCFAEAFAPALALALAASARALARCPRALGAAAFGRIGLANGRNMKLDSQ